MKNVIEDPEPYLAAASEMLAAEGMTEAAEILRISVPRVEATGYDNWNGGTTTWAIHLLVEPVYYSCLGSKREGLQDQIEKRLKPILDQYTSDWFNVIIAPKVEPRSGWRQTRTELAHNTRKDIVDALKVHSAAWSGALEEVELLQRLYDLEQISSNDIRFDNAAGDIWQHRVNNPDDWPDDWIFRDKRFNLLHGPSEIFLRFLCEMVHPVVRPDRDEALRLVSTFNEHLRSEGWKMVESEPIAGRPRFVAVRINTMDGRSLSRAKTVADALDAGWMQKEIERIESAIEHDPSLAIGTAKDLVESCCKTILVKRGVEIPKSADLPALTKLLAQNLQLVPEGIPDRARGAETIRLILRNLSALTQYLAELRGLYGTGHGRDGRHRGLDPRHARLAVGAAVAFIDFVTATHHQRG